MSYPITPLITPGGYIRIPEKIYEKWKSCPPTTPGAYIRAGLMPGYKPRGLYAKMYQHTSPLALTALKCFSGHIYSRTTEILVQPTHFLGSGTFAMHFNSAQTILIKPTSVQLTLYFPINRVAKIRTEKLSCQTPDWEKSGWEKPRSQNIGLLLATSFQA